MILAKVNGVSVRTTQQVADLMQGHNALSLHFRPKLASHLVSKEPTEEPALDSPAEAQLPLSNHHVPGKRHREQAVTSDTSGES